MGGHGGHHNSCNYSSGSSAGGGPTNKRHRPDHSPNGNDSDDDVDLLMDDANGSGPLSPGAESLIDSDNSDISLTGPPSPVGDVITSAGGAPISAGSGGDAAANLKSSVGGQQQTNPLGLSAGSLLSDSIHHHSRDHHAAAMALSSAGLIPPPPPSPPPHHHHHPSAFSFGHHPHHHPSFRKLRNSLPRCKQKLEWIPLYFCRSQFSDGCGGWTTLQPGGVTWQRAVNSVRRFWQSVRGGSRSLWRLVSIQRRNW